MMTVLCGPRAQCTLALLVLITAGTATAGEPPLRTDFEGRSAVAWPTALGVVVEISGQGADLIELPAGFFLDSLRGVAQGYLVAGSRPTKQGGHRLFVAESRGGQTRFLPPPPGAKGGKRAIQCQPTLLTEGGQLVGIAWLEGEAQDTLSVRAARWDGQGWRASETVSRFAGGSQLALTGAVLADGSWLLVWSRYDGNDDEIVASSSYGDGWSSVRRVSADNTVPDIAPALTAVGTGALLAWSRYDGNDYRLMKARYSAGHWSPETMIGAAGSLYPSFSGEGRKRTLLYRTAKPRSWTVVELNGRGKILRHAKVASPGASRPVAGLSEQGALRLSWPGRAKAAKVVEWTDGGVQ